jgi:hypothetical protein
MLKHCCTALLASALIGCAGYLPQANEYWMHSNGFGQATTSDLTACKYEAAKSGGYDWIDASLRRSKVFDLCMRTKGYIPRV